MKYIDSIPVFGNPIDEGALAQIKRCAMIADKVVMMADHHKGYAVPIGGVLAFKNHISPQGIGYDIACGNKAVLTDAKYDDIKDDMDKIMDLIVSTVSFGVGRNNNHKVDGVVFSHPAWELQHIAPLKKMAENQLGTVGSGNHYVDILIDQRERVWIGVHFGSRGLGHKIASHYLWKLHAKDDMDVEPSILDIQSELGQEYLLTMSLAGNYAYAGRDWVCDVVARIMGCNILDEVHNHHNYAWRELVDNEAHWVVRKGATPAFPGQRGFIGGSMGDDAVIAEGVESPLSSVTMHSTVHGAGRVMSRTAARGKINRKTGAVISTGAISKEAMDKWVRQDRGVVLRGADTDEAPQAYKRLPEVLAEHEGTIKILETLRPIGVAMAGKDIEDPYRD